MECLEQLLKVYVISEIRYVESALKEKNPMMRMLMEQCAIERSNFLLDIWHVAIKESDEIEFSELYAWHNQLYGRNYLNMMVGTSLNIDLLDRKALEICHVMIQLDLHQKLNCLLIEQATKIEASILAKAHFRTMD
ncbi:hypothetical protein ZORO111903_07675 [Zobellia roscoffensis]|uniref:hypothetical protein n=1 Tax=Zobellia roscoffensis TaxID=2779508 RepID=UPI00188A6504|nr:hypothetical protein [Zobellia roscoffensis]